MTFFYAVYRQLDLALFRVVTRLDTTRVRRELLDELHELRRAECRT